MRLPTSPTVSVPGHANGHSTRPMPSTHPCDQGGDPCVRGVFWSSSSSRPTTNLSLCRPTMTPTYPRRTVVWSRPATSGPEASRTPRLRGVLKEVDFFLLRTALRDRPKGPRGNHWPPPTANRHQPPTENRQQRPTTNRQPLPTAINHQSPTANRRQPPPTATNRHQPPVANRQPPTTHHPPPTHGVPAGFFGKTV